MREKRLSYIDDRTGEPITLRSLATKGNLDVAILHRAEDPANNTIPSLPFWFDWVDSMADKGLTFQSVLDEAQKRFRLTES